MTLRLTALSILAATILLPPAAAAQIFQDPQNLQVLPADTDAATLRETMRHFALATGLRCHHCHAGSEDLPLSEWDFASDEKELKKKARVMLKMVNEINDRHLAPYGEDRVRVQCVTCHRGVPKPRQLGEELALAAGDGGAEALQARYSDLRAQYLGSHSYDFTGFTISEAARAFAADGRPDQAFALLDAFLGDEPGDFNAHFTYGELKREQGDRAGALAHLNKALKLRPGSDFIARRIAQIEAEATEK